MCYCENITLAGVERHLPGLLPIFKLVPIFLESVGVCLCFDLPIKDGVLSKQSHYGPYIVVHVIDVDKEQGGANDRSVRNPGGHLANVGSLSLNPMTTFWVLFVRNSSIQRRI